MTAVDEPRTRRSVVLTVSGVVKETADAHSLMFDIPDAVRDQFDYKPGQFLTLRIPSVRTGSVARCYSLASSPFADDRPKVTVKRTVDGYGSNWVCDNVKVGDTLEVLPPSGVFTPKDLDDDLLLFAAGSGITPVMSILKSALVGGSGKVALVYANRDETSVIFADDLKNLADEYSSRFSVIHWLESRQGRPDALQLAALSAAFVQFESFMCGPAPFMAVAHDALARLGVPRARIHAEVFNSLSGDPFAATTATEADETDAATVDIDLDGETHRLRWPRTQTLVDIMLAKGIDVPYSCREGECGSCACTVREGKVVMANSGMLDAEDIARGYILGCQSRPVTDHIKVEF